MDRVLVNADAQESDVLLNQRMGYVAISRAREEAMIFTNSADQLRAALDRTVDKEMAVEALRQTSARDVMNHEEQQRLVNPWNTEAKAQQSFDLDPMTSSNADRTQNDMATPESPEFEINP